MLDAYERWVLVWTGRGWRAMWWDAVLLEGRSPREVARAHGISKSWIYELITRYRAGGYAALQPRSRKPRSCTHETPVEIVQAIVALRNDLVADGHDAVRSPCWR
jgi:transposase